jgi:PAS domain S-box-containing protein
MNKNDIEKRQLLDRIEELQKRIAQLEVQIEANKQIAREFDLRTQLLEKATDAFFVRDWDGNVIYMNESTFRIRGYTREEMMEITTGQMSDPEFVSYFRKRNMELEQGEKIVESFHSTKNGKKIPVEIHSRIIEIGDKKYIVNISHNISDRKKIEKEKEQLLTDIKKINNKLEESNKELQDFAYIASHDLREPLRKIASFGSLLQNSLEGKLDDDQKENFTFMIEGAARMQTMIDDLLTYSRTTTRAKPFEKVDLNHIITDFKNVELATKLEETSGKIEIPELLPFVFGDPSQVRQVLQNLIANGLKFTREGVSPVITIRTEPAENNMVLIKIQDNGIGIDEKYHEQVFTMFKRLHSRAKYEGTGIGLAVCKKIVKRHGGEIGITSKIGEGSTFWFTLPGGSFVKD